MIGDIGWQELLIILVIIALLFGAQRVADMGKALGKGVREFKSEAIAPAGPAPVVSAPPAASASPTAANVASEANLQALRQLHEQGVLTDEEFRLKQQALLERV